MNKRITMKVVNYIYENALNGNFEKAYERLKRSGAERKVHTLFNSTAFDKLGSEKGAELVMNFAMQKAILAKGGIKSISEEITNVVSESMNNAMCTALESAKNQVVDSLPKTTLGWLKLNLKEYWIQMKSGAKYVVEKIRTKMPKIDSSEAKVKPHRVKLNTKANIPQQYKTMFTELSEKNGQEFADFGYESMVKEMNLTGIAPKSMLIQKSNGLTATGGYSFTQNAISYSEDFLTKLPKSKVMEVVAHELKHCEQAANILRTEGITVRDFARANAESLVKEAIKENTLMDFHFTMRYKNAVKEGKGEEFLQKAIENLTEKLIPDIEANFAEVLKMPKIKSNSKEGMKAYKDLEALRKYEGLDVLGFGGEAYRLNPLEEEAYSFGNSIRDMYNAFVS